MDNILKTHLCYQRLDKNKQTKKLTDTDNWKNSEYMIRKSVKLIIGLLLWNITKMKRFKDLCCTIRTSYVARINKKAYLTGLPF